VTSGPASNTGPTHRIGIAAMESVPDVFTAQRCPILCGFATDFFRSFKDIFLRHKLLKRNPQ